MWRTTREWQNLHHGRRKTLWKWKKIRKTMVGRLGFISVMAKRGKKALGELWWCTCNRLSGPLINLKVVVKTQSFFCLGTWIICGVGGWKTLELRERERGTSFCTVLMTILTFYSKFFKNIRLKELIMIKNCKNLGYLI